MLKTKGKDHTRGGVYVVPKTHKGNDESLQKLVKLTLSTLKQETAIIEGLNIQEGEESPSQQKEGRVVGDSATEGSSSAVGVNDISETVIRKFYEYVLDEWVEKQWESTWAGEYGGTSGNSTSSTTNVMMTGRDSASSKKVLLKIKLSHDSPDEKYIVGEYKSTNENYKKEGVLTLGLGSCSEPRSPQCQIPKNQPITEKMKLKFMDPQKRKN